LAQSLTRVEEDVPKQLPLLAKTVFMFEKLPLNQLRNAKNNSVIALFAKSCFSTSYSYRAFWASIGPEPGHTTIDSSTIVLMAVPLLDEA
tara:strand:- start:8 stop:277 length:270 start_codon:yes stop_codon:yes gene_type:complete